MPRINQRFLLALIAIGLVLSGAIYGAYVFQLSRQTDFFLERADKAFEKGQIETAANLYRRVITHDRDNPQALGQLAACLDQLGKHFDAYMTYEAAARAAGNPDLYLTRQIELAILLSRWSDAQSLLARGLEKSPNDPKLLLLMAQSLYRQGHAEEAVAKFREVLAQDDPPEDAFFMLAIVLGEELRRVEEAEAVIDQLLSKHADAATAHVFAAQWFLKQLGDRPLGDGEDTPRSKFLREKISQSAKEALRLEPNGRSALLVALHEARLRRDETQVMELVERGATQHPDEPAFYELAAESAFRQGQPDVAEKWLERGLRKIPGHETLLWDFVSLKLDRNQIDAAEDRIHRHQDEMTAMLRQTLSGRVLVARRQWKAALEAFRAVESELTLQPQMARVVNYEQAICYGQLRQHDRQISALRRALDLQPFWMEAREALARALYASGRMDEAVQEFRAVVSNKKFTAASGLLMARLLIAQMSRRNAEAADWEEVDAFLKRLEADGVPHEEVVRLRCAMLVAMKQLDQAETYVRQEIDSSASQPAFLGLALIQSERREWAAALKTIRSAAEKFGDSVEVRYAEAVCLLASEQANPSRLRELATPPGDWPTQQKIDLAVQLLPVVVSANQLDLAEDTVNELIAHEPNTVSFHIERLNLANLKNDAKAAAAILQDIEQIAGRTAFWHYGQAVHIWTTRREDRALSDDHIKAAVQHLSEAALERPSWAQLPLLYAMLLDSAGNADGAISKYTQAIDLGVRDPQVIRRLVDLLMKSRRFEEADVTLRRLNEQVNPQSDSAPTLRIASEMSFHLARFENAVRLAEQAAQKSEAADDYLWLARLLELRDRDAEARAAMDKAVLLAPGSETVRLEQIRYLIRAEQTEEAEKSVAEFAKALDQRKDLGPSAQLALAECHLAVSHREEAAQVVVPLLAGSPESLEQLKRSVQVLDALQGASQTVPAVGNYLKRIMTISNDRDIQIWARRESALIAAGDIRHHDFQSAMALVEQNLSLDSASKEDIRAKALVLAAWPNAKRRAEAVSILETLHREGDLLHVGDRFLLAQLYVVKGEWVQGSRLMRQILAVTEQQTEQRVKFYANALLAQGEAQEGLLWAEKFLSLFPSADAVRLHARALMAARDTDRLLALLPPGETSGRMANHYREFLTPQDSTDILGRFAEELLASDRSDRKPQADRVIERCEQISQALRESNAFPGSGMARVLVSTGRLSEAIDLLEQTASTGSDLDVTQFVEAILASPKLSAADLDRLQKMVAAESERRSDPATLLLAVAQIQEKMQDFDGAMASYRKVIAKDDNNAAALNNLAFLLAFRGEDPNEAVAHARRAMELTGPVPAIIDTYAVALIQSGEWAEALELLRSIPKHSGLPVSHFHQAWAYSKSGDITAAKKSMLEAGKQGLRKESLHPAELPLYETLQSQDIRLDE